MKRLDIPVTLGSNTRVMQFAEDALFEMGASDKIVAKMMVAVDEVYSNIVFYSGASIASVILELSDDILTLEFIDDGIAYDPLTTPDPDINLSAEERKIGGLGIYMVRKSMDEMKYLYEGGKNILVLKKKFEPR